MLHSDLRGIRSISLIFGWEEAFGIVQKKVIQLKATKSLKDTERGSLHKGSNSMWILPCIFFAGTVLVSSCFEWTSWAMLVFCFPFLQAALVERGKFFPFCKVTRGCSKHARKESFKSTHEAHQKIASKIIATQVLVIFFLNFIFYLQPKSRGFLESYLR